MQIGMQWKKNTNAFKSEGLKYLNLKTSNQNAIIDLISVLPSTATQLATIENIMHGFLKAESLTKRVSVFPCFVKFLQNADSRHNIELSEFNKLKDVFLGFLNFVNDQ